MVLFIATQKRQCASPLFAISLIYYPSLPHSIFSGVGRSHLMKIVYNVIGIAGAPANLMVIFIVLKSRRMRDKPFNLLVLHQSFIDFLVGTNCTRLHGFLSLVADVKVHENVALMPQSFHSFIKKQLICFLK